MPWQPFANPLSETGDNPMAIHYSGFCAFLAGVAKVRDTSNGQ